MVARSLVGWSTIGLAAITWGCGPSGGDSAGRNEPFRGVELSLAAVAEPAILPSVAARLGEWEGSRGGTVRDRSDAPRIGDAAGADVLVFPGDRLGDLIDAGLLRPLPESLVEPPASGDGEDEGARQPVPDALDFAGVLEPYREAAVRYGPDRQGLAYGGSALVLVYRPEALQSAPDSLKAAAETAGVRLEPPSTWDELDSLAAFLDGRDWDGDGTPDSGLALATGDDPERIAADLFLARSASAALHPDFYSYLLNTGTMEPEIESPPFVEALVGLAHLAQTGPDEPLADAAAARAAFREGKTALLVDRAERVADWVEADSTRAVAVSPLPGSPRVYNPDRRDWEPAEGGLNRPAYLPRGGGWLVGVAAGTEHPEAAEDLVRYLVEAETASATRADPSFALLPVRGALIGMGPNSAAKSPGLDRRSWSDAVSRTLLADRVAVGLRIPEADGYLADLHAAIRPALGGSSPADALKTAADAWRERTERLGVDRQLWHLKRSLLGFATDPTPPPRPGAAR